MAYTPWVLMIIVISISYYYNNNYGVDAADKVYQSLHTDFINSETNNKKPPPSLPNQLALPKSPISITPAPNTRAGSGSNVRDLINKFNEQAGGNTQNQPSTQIPPRVVIQQTTTARNVPRENFPSLPKTGTTPKSQPGTQFSYSSIVSGNKQINSNIPNTATRGQFPNSQTVNSNTPVNREQVIPIPTAVTTKTVPTNIFTDNELKELSEQLYKKDNNSPLRYMNINYQGKTTSQSKTDQAPLPLITVQPAVWDIPTISALKILMDNYEQDVTINEYVTPQEKNEENTFLDLIMATPVMRHLMVSLKEKGLVSPDPKYQRDLLKQIWFNLYSRGQGKIGSSGFEHIFLSEIKNREISGLHNWLYFHLEEEAKRANYLGYMKSIEFGNKGGILKFHFNLKGIDKPVDSIFIGTSPEMEMALYTLCFMARPDKPCPLQIDGKYFGIRTYSYRYRSKNMIGSAFPEI